jgi:hypothetical protein
VCADAVLTTGPIAFAATQQAIGALEFLPLMATLKPVNSLGDPAGCLNGTFTTITLKELYLRQMRCSPYWLIEIVCFLHETCTSCGFVPQNVLYMQLCLSCAAPATNSVLRYTCMGVGCCDLVRRGWRYLGWR